MANFISVEKSGLKSSDGAQLTLQSATYVAISFYLVSCLVSPTSLHGVGKNIVEKMFKGEMSFITW